MATVQALTTRFEASIIQFEAQTRRMQATNSSALARVQAAHTNAQTNIARSWQRSNIGQSLQNSLGVSGINRQLSGMAGGMIATLGIGAVTAALAGAADSYTRFSNSLKVAGLEGLELARVQDQLYESALRNGVGLESLGSLYGSIQTSTKDLGVSQSQILTVTNAVSNSIRVAGTSAQAAAGAITQLGQALGSEKVSAEEYNSVKEGLRPLLQAAVDATGKYAGSVSKLTAEVKKGKVSNAELFQLIENGSKLLEERAAKAPLTLAAGIQNLTTAFTKYVGEQNNAISATTKLGDVLALAARNMDIMLETLITLAVYAGSVYVAALVKAGGAGVAAAVAQVMAQRSLAVQMATTSTAAQRLAIFQNTMNASMTRGATAAKVMAGGMRILTSSFGIGLVIMGVATAIMAVADAMGASERSTASLKAATDDYNSIMEDSAELMGETEDATNRYSNQNVNALAPTYDLCTANEKLAGSYYEVANAAYAAIQARLADRIDANKARIAEIDNPGMVANAGRGLRNGVTTLGLAGVAAMTGNPSLLRNAPLPNAPNANERIEQDQLRNQNAELMSQMIAITLDPRAQVRGGGGGGGGGAKTGGSKGRTPKEIEYQDAEMLHAALMTQLAVRIAQTTSLKERHRLEDLQAKKENDAAIEAVRNNERLTQAGKDDIIAAMKVTQALEATARARAREVEMVEQQIQLSATALENQHSLMSIEEDRLVIMAGLAATAEERWRLEDEATKSRRDRERQQREEEIKALEAQRRITKDVVERARLAEAIAQKRREGTAKEGTYNAEDQATGAGRATDLQKYITDLKNTKFNWSDTMLKGLQSLEEGLMGVVNGTKTLKDVWKDVAASVVADIMRVVIRALMMRAIMAAFPGLGGGGQGPVPADLTGLYASGTNYSKGGLALVGEKGPELVNLPGGSQVMPNNVLNAAMAAPKSGGGSSPVFNLTTVVNANNAVMRADIDQQIARAQMQAVQYAKQMTMKELADGQKRRLR